MINQHLKNSGLFIAFLSISFFGKSQYYQWAKGFGGSGIEAALSMDADPSGNIISTGSFRTTVDFDPGPATYNLVSAGTSDIYVLKQDAAGNLVWAVSIGGTGSESGTSITIDAGSNVYVAGYFQGTVDFDPGSGVQSLTADGTDGFVLKLNAAGELVWAKSFTGANSQQVSGVTVASDGSIYCTGDFYGSVDFDPNAGVSNITSNGANDIFLLKLDNSGSLSWVKKIGSSTNDIGVNVKTDGTGNVYFTGYFTGALDFDPGAGTESMTTPGQTYFVSKFDSGGNFIWVSEAGGSSPGDIFDMAVSQAGDVYVTGEFTSTTDFDPGTAVQNLTSAGFNDAFIYKLNTSGELMWAQRIGGPESDMAYGIDITSNAVYATGYFWDSATYPSGTLTGNGLFDIFIAKLDLSGNFQWIKTIGGEGYEVARSIVADNGAVYITGSFDSQTDFDPSSAVHALTPFSTNSQDVYVAKYAPLTVGLESHEDQARLTTAPNPTKGTVKLSFSAPAAQLVIYDAAGKIIWSGNVENGEAVSMEKYREGIYLFELKTETETFVTRIVRN